MAKSKRKQRGGKGSAEEKPKPSTAASPQRSKTATAHSAFSVASRHNNNSNSSDVFPQAFPSSLSYPSNDFLRDEAPYKESFQAAISTAYEGFVVDKTIEELKEVQIQASLDDLVKQQCFRTDVTQPFGLGTKCAKTYVTRCLLGEPGTTYKYLGLRMFAHPWGESKNNNSSKTMIQNLGQTLTNRTQQHLKALDKIRQARKAPPTRGRSEFDICLINRMEASNDLKPEPTMGKTKTSVSWHADSSLEHYSTIAVYQTIVSKAPDNKKRKHNNDWFVALRVAHNSEGPNASRRGTDIDSSIVKETPPIAANLPSGSAYYLLDDFNHHHQHTVLTTASATTSKNGKDKKRKDSVVAEEAGVRYSCTFRLLRDSHNVSHIIARCKTVCSNFHKKGAKIWRSEQLLLTELESEWIRQFYIQGLQHYELLWSSWGQSMQQLLRYWSQLESRTKQVIDMLRLAAEERCSIDGSASTQPPSKAERKLRERRRKALASMEDVLERTNVSPGDVPKTIHGPLAELLEERAEMRELWTKRAHDHVFRELAKEYRPMDLPVSFECAPDEKPNEGFGASPMVGTPQGLREAAQSIRALGQAYMSKNSKDLPTSTTTNETSEPTPIEDNHAKSLEWPGWEQISDFGLELQEPWALAVVEGRKPIETRAYNLPPALLGKRIYILQSSAGKAGISSMGNVVELNKTDAMTIIGWCVFSSVTEYTSRNDFEKDESKHLVKKDSGYGWKDGKTKVIYGWNIEKYCKIESADAVNYDTAVRRMRSLFQLKTPNARQTSGKRSSQQQANAQNKKGKNKKRRKRY